MRVALILTLFSSHDDEEDDHHAPSRIRGWISSTEDEDGSLFPTKGQYTENLRKRGGKDGHDSPRFQFSFTVAVCPSWYRPPTSCSILLNVYRSNRSRYHLPPSSSDRTEFSSVLWLLSFFFFAVTKIILKPQQPPSQSPPSDFSLFL